MSNFNQEKDELLIESVKCYNALYNKSDKEFKNYIYKHKCWEQISEIVQLPVADCKTRWKSLRDQYNKKIKEGSGTGSATWQYINLMSFMSDAPERRRSIARGIAVNDSLTSILKTELNTDIDSDGETTVGLNFECEANAENIPTAQVNVDTDEPPPGPSTSTIHPSTSKKRKQSKLQDKRESKRLNLLEALANNTQKQPQVQPPSATKKFFESMAEVVETFPPREQAIIRAKVCQLITDVEIKLS